MTLTVGRMSLTVGHDAAMALTVGKRNLEQDLGSAAEERGWVIIEEGQLGMLNPSKAALTNSVVQVVPTQRLREEVILMTSSSLYAEAEGEGWFERCE